MRSENVVAGLRACGIFPFDAEHVLSKLPHPDVSNEEREKSWTDSIVGHLAKLRNDNAASSDTGRRGRGKRLMVSPGKSVTK